ncbi:hypothetical protein ACFB49_42030 [Sphingomonas sp. DBB INV C78]|uniref:SET domain-containing protein n=1 Tax=Sphingomonas sp. DBB INV C78 TaxID=3349434 RepID=UPI0036D2D4A4
MITQAWWYAAIVCNITAYLFYWLGIRRQMVRPNRASWLIWSAATAIEAMTYQAVNHGAAQNIIFAISAMACILVTLAVWRQSEWQPPTRTESLCMGLSLAALVIWGVFQSAYWAHMLVVAAIPLSFIPTWQSAIADREHERSPAWGLWTIGDLATLLVIIAGLSDERAEIPYIFVELVCHASMWFIIGLATINPWRSFGFSRGDFYIREVDRAEPRIFAIGENHLGKAVFSAVPFAAGDRIIEFQGPRLHKSQLPKRISGQADRYVQIDADHYMGPSGGVDDLINHSCDPNAGLRFDGQGVYLHAIRDIQPGDEISWDYSTTLYESRWRMDCECRTHVCRGTIGDFAELADELRERYRGLGLVPPYLQ